VERTAMGTAMCQFGKFLTIRRSATAGTELLATPDDREVADVL
jgi:hypothetical protein